MPLTQAKPGPHYTSHSTVLLCGIVPLELIIIGLFDDYLINSFIFYDAVVALTMSPTPPKDVHALIFRICDYVT